jgi:replicative DNA helicase
MINGFSLDDILLAYALKDKQHTMELITSIDAKYFDDKQWVFEAVKSFFVDPKFKEIPTAAVIKEKLESDHHSREEVQTLVDAYSKLKTLSAQVDSAEFGWHLDKLRKRYNQKVQKECSEKIALVMAQGSDEESKIERANTLIKEANVDIDSIYRKQVYKEGSLSQSARERFEHYKFVEANPEAARGILTGYKEFDRITNGLHAGELMIIAGNTGTGKSVLMHNIGVNAYLGGNSSQSPLELLDQEKGYNVLYFTLEMPKEVIERRIDSCMGDVPYNHIRDGQLSLEDKKKYAGVCRFQMKFAKDFYVVDMPQKISTREIELKYVEILGSKFKPDLVIVDYMGIMSPNDSPDRGSSGSEADWLSLGQITEDLHTFARVYSVPVITGSQVNKPKDPNKPTYSTDRIARSGMAPTNANIVIQIGSREDEYLHTDMPIYVTKMRDGEQGAFTLNKNFAKMKIVDLDETNFADGYSDDSI